MLVFPRIPHDKKQSVKLTLADIKQAFVFRFVMGYTIKETALALHVSTYCIRYHTQPGYKEVENKRRVIKYLRLQKTDPDFLAKHRQLDNNYHARRRNNLEFIQWENKSGYRWRADNKDKVLAYDRKYRQTHQLEIRANQKKYRLRKRSQVK